MAFERSALLELLNARKCWDCGKDESGHPKPCPPYKEPEIRERDREHAAFMAARADDSDPFVYGRVRAYITRGYILASDALKSARSRLSLRGNEPNSGLGNEKLQDLKRELDEDRAWNQHNSHKFAKDKEK